TTERSALAEVSDQLSRTGEPLTSGQADTLLQIMTEERERTPITPFDPRFEGTSRTRFSAIMEGDNADQFYRAETDLNRRILSRAGSMLSPEQYQVFEARLNQYLEFQMTTVEMVRDATRQKEGR